MTCSPIAVLSLVMKVHVLSSNQIDFKSRADRALHMVVPTQKPDLMNWQCTIIVPANCFNRMFDCSIRVYGSFKN